MGRVQDGTSRTAMTASAQRPLAFLTFTSAASSYRDGQNHPGASLPVAKAD